jgi:hypothetical protein
MNLLIFRTTNISKDDFHLFHFSQKTISVDFMRAIIEA